MYIILWILQLFCYLSINASNDKNPTPKDDDSVISVIEKVDQLDKYLETMAKKSGRELMFIDVFPGVITTENDETVINRRDKKVTCAGANAILQIRKGVRKCLHGRFLYKKFELKKICSPKVARSSLYFNGVLMHCVGSKKMDVVAGQLKCNGEIFSDEEMNFRCPLAGRLPSRSSTLIGYDGGINGLDQRSSSGYYNLGNVGCDSGITVSFRHEGITYFCMGKGVHVVEFNDGFRFKCNDRQLTAADYLHMCGNNGNIRNEFGRPAFVNIDASSRCRGKLIAVRAMHNGELLGFCIGHTVLVTFTQPDVFFCHGGVPLTVSDSKKTCKMAPAETVYIKTN